MVIDIARERVRGKDRFMKMVLLVLVLAVGLIGLAGCTTGENPPEPSASPEASPEAARNPPVRSVYTGVAESIEQDKVSIKETGSDTVTIVVTVSDDTYILDGQTGDAKAIDSIKAGEAVAAVTKPVSAQSMPPQSPGLVIFVNLPTEGLPPTYAIVKEVSTDEENQTWLVTDEDVNWRISAETPLMPYKAGAPITMDQLKPGMQVVGWYSTTTRSMPAQASPEKILVLPAVAEGQ